MKHTLNIFGRSVDLTEEPLEKLRELLGIQPVKLSEVPVGATFNAGGREYIVLEHFSADPVVLLKDIYKSGVEFGAENNCYEGSYADSACCDFLAEICGSIGSENIVEFDLDLTSDDGLKDYGVIKRSAALLTTEMYRRYVDILDKYMPEEYWWLSTPHSTKRHGNDSWVKCVSPSGRIDDIHYYYFDCGVRPFCIFESSIFVSV